MIMQQSCNLLLTSGRLVFKLNKFSIGTSCIIRNKTSHLLLVNNLNRRNNSSVAQVNPFYEDYKQHHIPINLFQRAVLAVGSSLTSLVDPTRADMIAISGEASGQPALEFMRSQMLSSDEGRKILKDKPRINSRTINLEQLESLPENTLGKIYDNFLKKNKVTPDSRLTVQFVDDVELAYVMQRYREAHDLVHAILQQPTNMLGEVTVKWVEAIQTRLPMCVGGAVFGAMRLAPKQRLKYVETNLPWAIKTGLTSEFLMNIYFEKRWEQPIEEIYQEFKITPIDK